MAGCRPEHLPYVIAAVQCLTDPRMHLRIKAMSTGPDAPLILVNGPGRGEVGINSGACALGPGAPSFANSVIGRALRTLHMNIGYTYATVSDLDTIGSPAKYSFCFGENEARKPLGSLPRGAWVRIDRHDCYRALCGWMTDGVRLQECGPRVTV